MSYDTDLVLINPPSLFEFPDIEQPGTLYIPKGLRMKSMNPGLLSIATFLMAKGFDLKIIDGSLDRDYSKIKHQIEKSNSMIYGIGSISGYDFIEGLNIAKFIKEIHPESTVIMGGQHVGPLGSIVLRDSPHVDAVIKYEGETVCDEILTRFKKGEKDFDGIPGVVFRYGEKIIENTGFPRIVDLNEMPFLKYELYPNYKNFTPFVEESRGCVFGCSYCSSNLINHGKMRFKKPDRFLAEMEHCYSIYGDKLPYAVLASTFGAIPENGKKIAKGVKKFAITWGTEFRADTKWEYFIDEMYNSGSDVVSVGLESASPKILRYMKKTNDPKFYLDRMTKLAKVVEQYKGMSTQLNFIFYAGDTRETVKETIKFLLDNPEIDAVDFSPLLLFNGAPVMKEFNYFRERYGSEMIRTKFWEKRHLYPVSPSRDFSYEDAVSLGHVLEKLFSNEDAWVQAQKYSYSMVDTSDSRWKKLKNSRFGDG